MMHSYIFFSLHKPSKCGFEGCYHLLSKQKFQMEKASVHAGFYALKSTF